MAKVVKGTATAVRYTIDVSGGGDSVSTSHHAIFKIGDTTVVFTSASPPIIGDGDQLVVAGRQRGKMLVALAYVNRTAMIHGNSGLWQNLLGAAFALPVGAFGLALALLGSVVPSLPEIDVLALRLLVLGAGLLFSGVGLLLLYRWATIRWAVKLLEEG